MTIPTTADIAGLRPTIADLPPLYDDDPRRFRFEPRLAREVPHEHWADMWLTVDGQPRVQVLASGIYRWEEQPYGLLGFSHLHHYVWVMGSPQLAAAFCPDGMRGLARRDVPVLIEPYAEQDTLDVIPAWKVELKARWSGVTEVIYRMPTCWRIDVDQYVLTMPQGATETVTAD